MRIAATLPTIYGRRLAVEPEPLCIGSDADRADLARRLDRDAAAALAEGEYRVADALTWRAAGLRETPR
jgi:hypothetical protein